MKRIDVLPAPNLEIRDLRLVLALIEAGTTARAAGVLHRTQPSVSRALLGLEERLGTELFVRVPKGLVPTDAGARVAERARELLEELRELERALSSPPTPKRSVRLVCECYTAYHWLPRALKALRDDFPDVELSLRIEHTSDPHAAFAAHEVDVALLTSSTPARADLRVKPLFSDEIVFVVAKDHALAAAPHLTPEDLVRHPLFISRSSRPENRWFMTTVFGRKRPRLAVSVIPLAESIAALAREGLGIGLLTEWVCRPYLDQGGLVAKRLESGPLKRPWRLAWRPELGAIGPRLRRALRARVG